MDDLQVRCWGYNNAGQLGLGHTNSIGDNETPGDAPVVSLGAGRTARAVAAGYRHTCAILDDGTVKCWGANSSGQLGLGRTDNIGDNETPNTTAVVSLGAGRTAKALSVSGNNTCAILDNGTVKCWGNNQFGQLGQGHTSTIGDNETPASLEAVSIGSRRTAISITMSGEHTSFGPDFQHACVVLDTAQVRCWGANKYGQLGLNHPENLGDNELPSAEPAISPDNFASVIAGTKYLRSRGGRPVALLGCQRLRPTRYWHSERYRRRRDTLDVTDGHPGHRKFSSFHQRRTRPHVRGHAYHSGQMLGLQQFWPTRFGSHKQHW